MTETRPSPIPRHIVKLMEKGVQIPIPSAIDIGEEVSLDRISGDGVWIYGGSRIYGRSTLIGRGARLGFEAPVTLDDCQLGADVKLNGGFCKSSVFLDKAAAGSGAQIREGCILEEEANTAHTVGLKQTILFPFVTLGSLINFCDCFMAGGTSRKNHSEVGSSYIHFNYTPNQDKATPSLLGDVPAGVMLNQNPIFLGGQGGLSGPVRIGYGSVTAAGTICRRDYPQGGVVITESPWTRSEEAFTPGLYRDIGRKVRNNVIYIANLLALRQWYLHVRRPFFKGREHGDELFTGAMDKLDLALKERLKRFREFSEKMDDSIRLVERKLPAGNRETILTRQREFRANWPVVELCLTDGREADWGLKERDDFLHHVETEQKKGVTDYIQTIQGLSNRGVSTGTEWLRQVVDRTTFRVLEQIPSCKS
jgi:bifunctional UDP-N-acetylglucosamine pyrophosphorylase / glucosamine-1-phosphate N-acetyltransferase